MRVVGTIYRYIIYILLQYAGVRWWETFFLLKNVSCKCVKMEKGLCTFLFYRNHLDKVTDCRCMGTMYHNNIIIMVCTVFLYLNTKNCIRRSFHRRAAALR